MEVPSGLEVTPLFILTNEQEEAEYVELLAAEKHQAEALERVRRQNRSLSVLDGVLEDVRKAADRLEEEIEEHAFDDNKSVSSSPEPPPSLLSCLRRACVVEVTCMHVLSTG